MNRGSCSCLFGVLLAAVANCGEKTEAPDCTKVTFDKCEATSGCVLLPAACDGVPFACDVHRDERACAGSGCDWSGQACTGEAAPCELDSVSCSSFESGCAWTDAACVARDSSKAE